MAENTKIEWCDATFNPWRGCSKISKGCENCYAETMSKRNPAVLGEWGPHGTRVVASESMWQQPLRWNREAKKAGERRRVFTASLTDVFEDWKGPMVTAQGVQLWKRSNGSWTTSDHYRDTVMLTMADVRAELFQLILDTPHLDWLLLTKRPENIKWMALAAWGCFDDDKYTCPENVWLGVSVENQAAADERIPILLQTPAHVRFLSVEPLLGAVDLRSLNSGSDSAFNVWERKCVDWVIVGGESGPRARPMHLEWARSIVEQCQAAGVPVFVKQLGADPWESTLPGDSYADGSPRYGRTSLRLRDSKGGDMSEFPEDLRIREFPNIKEC